MSETLEQTALRVAAEMDNVYLRNVPAVVLQEFARRLVAALGYEIDFTPKWSDLVCYDESSDSGLRWIVDAKKGPVKAGDIAGSKCKGYWVICFANRLYQAQRVISELFNGEIKDGFVVDHVNGNSLDNRIDNLAVKSLRHNSQNQKKRKDNKTGVTGVCRSVDSGYASYKVQWRDNDGRKRSKRFAISKLGEDVAKESAIAFRANVISTLNAQGQNYTDTHGVRTGITTAAPEYKP